MASAPVALVTGGARGIGRAIALELASRGYRLAVNYHRSQAEADSLLAEAREKYAGEAMLVKADVSRSAEAERMVREVFGRWQSLDVLVNNAGIARDRTILKMKDAEWEEVIGINLTGAFWCLREVARVMAKQQRGCIINMGSYVGARATVGTANYAAAKAGLVALTKSAALELGRFNVRVNAVLPGFHRTGIGGPVWERRQETLLQEHTLGRTTNLSELARFVANLADQQSVSGQVFNFDSRLL